MFVELHMIQNFAPANLNRDDTNNPKDAEFGGVRRARISSQCLKRAIRTAPVFAEITGVDNGIRTRWVTRLLADELKRRVQDAAQAEQIAQAFAAAYSGKMDSTEKSRTSVLLYLSRQEIERFTQTLIDQWPALTSGSEKQVEEALKDLVKKLIKETRDRTSAPDIALFGRMLADKPELSLDAACQVAHAISTHRISMDMDFFTAVDDLRERDETGAGMMGYTGFNSATFYRYARIDWKQLVKNLNGDRDLARRTVEGFLHAAVVAVPTGKQNSFAAQNPPSFLLGVVREDGVHWSLANAFERPVTAFRDSGYIRPSIEALDTYWGQLSRLFPSSPVAVAALNLEDGVTLKNLGDGVLTPDLASWIKTLIAPLA
jgi:CRISPR system Cascade subunit CasC